MERIETVADRLVSRLVTMGVRAVFGVPGGAVEPLYDALARASRAGTLRLVTARHETGAAYMAYGWRLETGSAAAVVTTTGPGATNALAGIACANVERVPMFLLTAQVASPKQGRNALQECSAASGVDTMAMYAACTKCSATLTYPSQLDTILAIAYARSHERPSGPVHLSFPTDMLRLPAPESVRAPDYRVLVRSATPIADPEDVRWCADIIDRAQKPVILLGERARPSVTAAFALAERIDASVCVALSSSGTVSDAHPLHAGRFGFAGHSAASAAVDTSDLVIMAGLSGGELEAAAWGPHLARAIHVSDSIASLALTSEAFGNVLGDPKATLESLAHVVRSRTRSAGRPTWKPRTTKTPASSGVAPQALIRALAQRLPEDAVLYVDNGNAIAWMTHHYFARRPYGPIRMSLNYASMGWTVGASVGASLASSRPIATIVGDGALLMSGQEFSVAVQEQLATVFIVLNDSALGMVRHGQMLGGAERVAFELPRTDFAAMARAMGGHGIRVRTLCDVLALDWTAIFERKGPTIVDVRIDGDQVPPMGARVRALTK